MYTVYIELLVKHSGKSMPFMRKWMLYCSKTFACCNCSECKVVTISWLTSRAASVRVLLLDSLEKTEMRECAVAYVILILLQIR